MLWVTLIMVTLHILSPDWQTTQFYRAEDEKPVKMRVIWNIDNLTRGWGPGKPCAFGPDPLTRRVCAECCAMAGPWFAAPSGTR